MLKPLLLAALMLSAVTLAQAEKEQEQKALPMNQVTRDSITEDSPDLYTFQATETGVLTVVVRPLNEANLDISLIDKFGRSLGYSSGYDGYQLSVNIPAADTYSVRVGITDDSCRYSIGATFLPIQNPIGVEPMPDPINTEVGKVSTIRLAADEVEKWYKLDAPSDGILTIFTDADEAEETDVFLELHDSESGELIAESDHDFPHPASEVMSTRVTRGEKLFVKIGLYETGKEITFGTVFTPLGKTDAAQH